jgi:geranylgeranyl diphosphate synthase type II
MLETQAGTRPVNLPPMPTSLVSFSKHAEQLRTLIDARLESYTDFGPNCPTRLQEAIRYSLLSPGKRLRPLLVLFAAEACGCNTTQAMPAACAVEMVHAYSLIHDDLPAMDDDDLRRSRPTCHKQFDEATAILAGDALLAQSFEILAGQVQPPDVAAQCCKTLATAAGPTMLVGGQADDLAGSEQAAADLDAEQQLELLTSIHQRKTGAMFRASVRLGCLVAGADSRQLEALDEYSDKLGLAFQIVDDLLDVSGQENATGKRVGKDRMKGKLTYPGLLGEVESERRAKAMIDRACAAVSSLGDHSANLESLARFVVKRDR